jgi:hypothetical protein
VCINHSPSLPLSLFLLLMSVSVFIYINIYTYASPSLYIYTWPLLVVYLYREFGLAYTTRTLCYLEHMNQTNDELLLGIESCRRCVGFVVL